MRTLAPEKIAALERMATGSGGEASNARQVLAKIGTKMPSASGAGMPPVIPPTRKKYVIFWWK